MFSDCSVCVAQLLELDSKILPFIVAVSGRVGSETPIKCEHSGIRGVIVEETVCCRLMISAWNLVCFLV